MRVKPAKLQTTVAQPAGAEGVGLHTGLRVRFHLTEAAADEGIVIIRADLEGSPCIYVRPESVRRGALQRRTELVGEAGAIVATLEHLLAACLGLGLDNVRVWVDGPEMPIFDGSALPYVEVIREAGLTSLEAPRRAWRLRQPVTLINGNAEIMAVPAEQMELAFFAEFPHEGMASQSAALALESEDFARCLAPARTFCFYEEVEPLLEAGLIRGGSMDCAIVIREGRPLGGDYRLPNELACHKLVDLIGDLAVLGRPVKALITARGSGHALNHAFIEMLRKELVEDE